MMPFLEWCRWKLQHLRPLPKLRYFLEVYEPGDRRECAATFNTSTPFVAIRTGDILNPAFWRCAADPTTLLRVTRVEHIIWNHGGAPAHKVCVYTETSA